MPNLRLSRWFLALSFILIPLGYCLWQVWQFWQADLLLRDCLISAADLAYPVSANSSDMEVTDVVSPISDPVSSHERIPRILHQTYKSAAVPIQWLEAQASCQALHQLDWEYMFWTDSDAEDFLIQHYFWFLPTYLGYPYDIQRADAIRYFILYHFGGVYLDLDVGCQKDLSPLLSYEAILPLTLPFGVSNDVIAVARNHSFFEYVIYSLTQDNHIWGTKYPTVIFSTGPMFLSRRLHEYLRQHAVTDFSRTGLAMCSNHSAAGETQSEGICVLPPDLYDSTPSSFFLHYPGSSWHGNDALAVRILIEYKHVVAVTLGLSIGVWWVFRMRRQLGHISATFVKSCTRYLCLHRIKA